MAFFSLSKSSRNISPIDIIINFKGARYKKGTGLSVSVKFWKKGQCSETKEHVQGKSINARLKKLSLTADKTVSYFIEKNVIPTPIEFWNVFSTIANDGIYVAKIYGFVEYFNNRIAEKSKNLRPDSMRCYITTRNWLIKYEQDKNVILKFNDIDIVFYRKLQEYMYAKKYSENAFGALIKCIKVVFRDAREIDNLHNLTFTEHRDFITTAQTADTVYLNEDELTKIYNCDLSPDSIRGKLEMTKSMPHNIQRASEALLVCRNKFLIGCYTALRVSDLNRLDNINIKDGVIAIKTQKTGMKIVVPIHPVVHEIIDSGFDLSKVISSQKINNSIKKICRVAGIDELVETSITKGGKVITTRHPKYELITNHTARRSGATNMYKAGIPTLLIMKITGHTTEKSFLKYIKVTAEETAELLKKHPFFTGKHNN